MYYLFFVLLISFVCPTASFAAEPETIRVGYFAFPGYHEISQDENGSQGSGYGFDFLQLLRRYTNLNYQYIGYEDSWQDMQQMLRDGKIDIVTSARKTSQREKEFAFSSPIGTSYAELSVRSDDKRFQLNDYDSFDGMTIGVLKGNSRNEDLAALAKEQGFTYYAVENGEMVGIIPDYFAHLMEMAGLPYSVMIAENRAQYYEWVTNNAADLYMDISEERSTFLDENSGLCTDSYIQLTLSRVTKKDFQGEIHTVAVAYNQIYDGIDIDLAENVQTIPYDTRKEAMEAVRMESQMPAMYTLIWQKNISIRIRMES